jgi:hypothetical protein
MRHFAAPLIVVIAVVSSLGAAPSADVAPAAVECGYFDDWRDYVPILPDDRMHAGMGGGLAAVEAAYGPPTGTYQQVGSRSGNNYHDWADGGTIAESHAICGDSTYYPYPTG